MGWLDRAKKMYVSLDRQVQRSVARGNYDQDAADARDLIQEMTTRLAAYEMVAHQWTEFRRRVAREDYR
jgi:hypothetical protein